MLSVHFRWVSLFALCCTLPAAPALCQQVPASGPMVITTGKGEVESKPDRASLEFTVETRAPSAAAAGAENSRRQRAVLDTLQRVGVLADQIQTASLQVTPEIVYPGSGQSPKVTGYVARNSVRVEVQKLEMTGLLVDAALAKGANGIAGLTFFSSRAAELRREALSKAVSAARLDAEAMARAAGYQLSGLIEISAGAGESPVMLSVDLARPRMMAAPEPTPVSVGTLKVVEVVSVRWSVKQ